MYNKLYILKQMFHIYSFNANGLRNLQKVMNLFSLMSDWNCDFCLIQESYWTNDLMLEIEKLWNGSFYYNNNNKSHGGVAILIHNRWKYHIFSRTLEGL